MSDLYGQRFGYERIVKGKGESCLGLNVSPWNSLHANEWQLLLQTPIIDKAGHISTGDGPLCTLLWQPSLLVENAIKDWAMYIIKDGMFLGWQFFTGAMFTTAVLLLLHLYRFSIGYANGHTFYMTAI